MTRPEIITKLQDLDTVKGRAYERSIKAHEAMIEEAKDYWDAVQVYREVEAQQNTLIAELAEQAALTPALPTPALPLPLLPKLAYVLEPVAMSDHAALMALPPPPDEAPKPRTRCCRATSTPPKLSELSGWDVLALALLKDGPHHWKQIRDATDPTLNKNQCCGRLYRMRDLKKIVYVEGIASLPVPSTQEVWKHTLDTVISDMK